MALLSASDLRRLERACPRGISSGAIVAAFTARGERFSAATLRKYVQLGLLPKSRRVGARGRHRGSSGLYPVSVVRLINEIKRALDQGATLDEIRLGRVGMSGEIQTLQRASDQVAARFAEALRFQPTDRRLGNLKTALVRHSRALSREIRALDRVAARLAPPRIDVGPFDLHPVLRREW
jgi:DNA-binding transcriptional MerR regulator